jgi:hypothetical protein
MRQNTFRGLCDDDATKRARFFINPSSPPPLSLQAASTAPTPSLRCRR